MSYHSILRHLSRHFRGRRFFFESTFSGHTKAYYRTKTIVNLFYGFSFMFGLSEINWSYPVLIRSQFVDVLWPFKLFGNYIVPVLIQFGFLSWIVASLVCLLNSNFRIVRFFQALGVFIVVGLRNSDGHFGHNDYAFLWVSMMLVFLPSAGGNKGLGSREQKHRYIMGFWTAQFVICVFYLMTGLWKVRSILECVAFNRSCELSHKILTNIGAQELVQYRPYAPLSWILFEYPWIAFFSYMGTIWIHLYSIHFAFRPALHVPFGFLRILFHLGTFVLFGINFSSFTWPVAIIFLCSPFYPHERSLLAIVRDLPPFDQWIRLFRQVAKALLGS